MSANTALAISLGLLGAIATWLFLGPLGGMLAIWAAFIAWGTFFHCGGKESGLSSAILGNVAGAVIAGITLWVATQTGIGAQARPTDLGGNLRWHRCCRDGPTSQYPSVCCYPGASLWICLGGGVDTSWERRRKTGRNLDGEPGGRYHPVHDCGRDLWLCIRESRGHVGVNLGQRRRRRPSRTAAMNSPDLSA